MSLWLTLMFIGYVFGCLHGSQLIGRIKNVNLKKSGTKNSGASNATLMLGWRSGMLVAFIDVGKAILSLHVAGVILFKYHVDVNMWDFYLLMNGLFVIIGHNYPMTMRFKGGKGTASFLGLLLIFNWKLAIFSLFFALLIAFIANYFVLGTFSGYLIFNLHLIFAYEKEIAMLGLFFTMLFVVTHMENFRRILNKDEIKLRTLFRRQAS